MAVLATQNNPIPSGSVDLPTLSRVVLAPRPNQTFPTAQNITAEPTAKHALEGMLRTHAANSAANAQVINPDDMRTVEELVKNHRVHVWVVPEGGNVESPVRREITSQLKDIRAKGPIVIDGQVISIQIEMGLKLQRDPKVANQKFLDPQNPGFAIARVYEDRSKLRSDTMDSGYNESLVIYPPLALTPGNAARPAVAPLNLNLSQLGGDFEGKSVSGLLFQQAIPPKYSVSGYQIYSALGKNDPVSDNERQSQLKSIAADLSAAEQLWGVQPGGLAKNIRIIKSDHYIGYCNLQNPDTVNLDVDQIARMPRRDAELTAQHEVFHLADIATGMRLSGGTMAKRFEEIKQSNPKFLKQMSEASFEGVRSGQSEADQSPQEFAATFATSLRAPDLEAQLLSRDKKFLMEYYLTCSALQANVMKAQYQQKVIAKDIPFMKDLQNAMTLIERELSSSDPRRTTTQQQQQ